jgi:hypothetical protein
MDRSREPSMSGVETPILADDSGRRRRRLRVLARMLSGALILWLGILALGALGLEPLGGLPVLGLTPGRATPSELPARIQAAVRTHRAIALSSTVHGELPADARSTTRSVRRGGPATGRSPRTRATPRRSGRVLPHTRTAPVGSAAPGDLAPTPATPVAPGKSGTTPATTSPIPPGRSGTTPAPATPGRPEQPGRSGTTPTPPEPAPRGSDPAVTTPTL